MRWACGIALPRYRPFPLSSQYISSSWYRVMASTPFQLLDHVFSQIFVPQHDNVDFDLTHKAEFHKVIARNGKFFSLKKYEARRWGTSSGMPLFLWSPRLARQYVLWFFEIQRLGRYLRQLLGAALRARCCASALLCIFCSFFQEPLGPFTPSIIFFNSCEMSEVLT